MRLRKLERDFIHADLAAVKDLISQLGDEDVMARMALEERRRELEEKIAELQSIPDHPTASAALFFGGRPVIGRRGIETEFGGAALAKFQDLVAKVQAHKSGGLGQRGVVPNKAASTLHVTDIVRGSFGFLLEEVGEQQQIVETPLKWAVDEVTRLLESFGEPDEEHFQLAVEAIDQRVLGTAREFFDLMRQDGATLRLVVGQHDKSFGQDAVARAAERATNTRVEETEDSIRGQLAGVLPDARQFEFRAKDPERTIRGKIDPAIPDFEVKHFLRDLIDVEASARVYIKRVIRNGELKREAFTLLALSELAPPLVPSDD
jgi:hypothetical protein